MTRYLLTFAALIVLTAINVAVSTLNLGTRVGIAVAFLIAALEAALAAVVFMHLSVERKWIYGTVVLTLILLASLLFWPAWDLYERPRL